MNTTDLRFVRSIPVVDDSGQLRTVDAYRQFVISVDGDGNRAERPNLWVLKTPDGRDVSPLSKGVYTVPSLGLTLRATDPNEPPF